MEKFVTSVTVQNVVELLRMRAEILDIMRGPDPEGETLRWLLRTGWPRTQTCCAPAGYVSALPSAASEPPGGKADAELVNAGRVRRARITADGGRKKRSQRNH
jgi:hypothetical protein